MHTYLAIPPLPKWTCLSLMPQLEAIVTEFSIVQALRLRANPWQLHGAEHFPPMNGTYSHAGFHSCQTSYFNMKVVVFIKPGIFLKPLLT